MFVEADHERWMRDALREADRAYRAGDVPVGAVVVSEGRIIGRGHNRVEALGDPTAHAEIIAIGAAAATREDWRLEGAVLYVTCEPCLMCAGAIHWSRLEGLVFGADQPESGVFGSQMDIIGQRWYNRALWIQRGVLREPCREILTRFFEESRRGARVVDWDGLENRCAGNRTVGSNPTLSANHQSEPDGDASAGDDHHDRGHSRGDPGDGPGGDRRGNRADP